MLEQKLNLDMKYLEAEISKRAEAKKEATIKEAEGKAEGRVEALLDFVNKNLTTLVDVIKAIWGEERSI